MCVKIIAIQQANTRLIAIAIPVRFYRSWRISWLRAKRGQRTRVLRWHNHDYAGSLHTFSHHQFWSYFFGGVNQRPRHQLKRFLQVPPETDAAVERCSERDRRVVANGRSNADRAIDNFSDCHCLGA